MGWGGSLPRAAASAALPWAYYLAAPGGAPEAAWQPGDAEELVVVCGEPPAPGKAGFGLVFNLSVRPGLPDPKRWAVSALIPKTFWELKAFPRCDGRPSAWKQSKKPA